MAPAIAPRTLWACQPVAFIKAAIVVPSGLRSRAMTFASFVFSRFAGLLAVAPTAGAAAAGFALLGRLVFDGDFARAVRAGAFLLGMVLSRVWRRERRHWLKPRVGM